MRKITKSIIAIMLVAIMCMTGVTAFATNEKLNTDTGITPRLSHLEDALFYFSATDNGGNAEVLYYGYDSFARAEITIKVEKRFLLVFWNDVDEWSASSTDAEDYFFHTFTLNGSGTYRATFTLKITGNNGTVDTIEQVIESKY